MQKVNTEPIMEDWMLNKWFTGLVDKRESEIKEMDFFLESRLSNDSQLQVGASIKSQHKAM